ncbi:MAG: hypothetical protein JXR91_01835 [Deltaproteobacteria bacterium]|nr:hypothetical protein [Deltaproteobacteria bacterium]
MNEKETSSLDFDVSISKKAVKAQWRKETGHRFLTADCIVAVRSHEKYKGGQRLIDHNRKKRPSVGFVFESAVLLTPGTLIEIDIKFIDNSPVYRTVGVVAWIDENNRNEKNNRENNLIFDVGVSILWMSKPGLRNSLAPPPPVKSDLDNRVDERVENSLKPAVPEDNSLPVDDFMPETNISAPLPVSNDFTNNKTMISDSGNQAENISSEIPLSESNDSKDDKKGKDSVYPETPEALVGIMPTASGISELLEGLLGEEIEVKESETLILKTDNISISGEYEEDDGTIAAYILLSFELGVMMGAALSMIPKGTVTDEIENSKLNDEVRDNLHEILNIAASLLNNSDKAHHKFTRMGLSINEDIDAELQNNIENAVSRRDFTVSIPGYGDGVMSYILLGNRD